MELSADTLNATAKSVEVFSKANSLYECAIKWITPLYKHQYINLIRKYINSEQYGGRGYKYKITTNLDIVTANDTTEYCTTLTCKNRIKYYWLTGKMPEQVESYSIQKLKEHNDDDYNLSIQVTRIDKQKTKPKSNGQFQFRYKTSYHIDTPNGILVVSIVKMSTEGTSFRNSNVLNNSPQYNIELRVPESIQNDASRSLNSEDYAKSMLQEIAAAISIVECSAYPLTNKVKKDIISHVSSINLPLPTYKPLAPKNLTELDEYAYGLLPDGQRVFLLIDKNVCYMIKDNEVSSTDIKLDNDTYDKTIFEGVWVESISAIVLLDTVVQKKTFDARIKTLQDFYKTVTAKDRLRVIEYLSAKGNNVYEELGVMWAQRESMDYSVNSILFKPVKETYNNDKLETYMWSYVPVITFLARYVREENGEISTKPVVSETTGIITQYKLLELNVSVIESEFDNKYKKWNRDVVIKPFTPGEALIPMDTTDIADEMIVYAKYIDDKWDVTPAIYETDLYQNGKINATVFSEKRASLIWDSITTKKVTLQMLVSGIVSQQGGQIPGGTTGFLSRLEIAETKYPFQNFQNLIVRRIILKEAFAGESENPSKTLLDVASGRLTDMVNWIECDVKEVVAIEINKQNLAYSKTMYLEYPGDKPTVHFIWADPSQLFFPRYRAGLNKIAKLALEEFIPQKWAFDVVTLEGSLAYYFENEEKLRGLMQNLNDTTKIGGKVVGTALDGEKVYAALKTHALDGWIKKGYGDTVMRKRQPNYGMKIVVERNENIVYEEYLVSFDYLDKIMNEYGFERVLVNSFSAYEGEEQLRLNNIPENISTISKLTDAERAFSNLHNSFIYKKTQHSSELLYRHLVAMYQGDE